MSVCIKCRACDKELLDVSRRALTATIIVDLDPTTHRI
jgi:hypothetical protein